MTLTLSKTVPEHRETLTVLWCRKDAFGMNQHWRNIRSNLGDPLDTCFWCHYEFIDGDMMALACVKGKGNKMLCQECAEELLVSKEGA